MCHDVHTQERFYALQKTIPRAKQMRDLFVCLAQQEPSSDSSSSPAPAAAGSSSPAPAAAGSSSPAPAGSSSSRAGSMRTRLRPSVAQFLARKVKERVGISPRKSRRRAVIILKKLTVEWFSSVLYIYYSCCVSVLYIYSCYVQVLNIYSCSVF